jgi:hypothetical protein
LDISSNHIHDAGARVLTAGISENKSLVHLDMTNNNINEEGLVRLAEGFMFNMDICSLKLFWDNFFGPQSIGMFKKVLDSKSDLVADFTIYSDVTGELNIAHINIDVPEEFLI